MKAKTVEQKKQCDIRQKHSDFHGKKKENDLRLSPKHGWV
jgi:hypothetical protein